MKRSLLLLALAVFPLGASSMAQDAEPIGDGQHRVAYAVDPVTGEYSYVEDIDPLLFSPSEASPLETTAPSGNLMWYTPRNARIGLIRVLGLHTRHRVLFLGICGLTYRYLVRYTFIGTALNGRRKRSG